MKFCFELDVGPMEEVVHIRLVYQIWIFHNFLRSGRCHSLILFFGSLNQYWTINSKFENRQGPLVIIFPQPLTHGSSMPHWTLGTRRVGPLLLLPHAIVPSRRVPFPFLLPLRYPSRVKLLPHLLFSSFPLFCSTMPPSHHRCCHRSAALTVARGRCSPKWCWQWHRRLVWWVAA
jgi:hypothetical protein